MGPRCGRLQGGTPGAGRVTARDVLRARDRSGHDVDAGHCVPRRYFDRGVSRSRSSRSTFLPTAKSSTSPRICGRRRVATCRARVARGQRDAPGHRRHRHHQSARNHAVVGSRAPAGRCIAPSSGRIAAPPACARASRPRVTSRCSRPRPGFCSTRISPAPSSHGCLTTPPTPAIAAARGELAFGTVDSYLLWRLTGGKVHATDATNASRTLLYRYPRWPLGRSVVGGCSACRAPFCRKSMIVPPTSASPIRRCLVRRFRSAAWRAISRPR